MQIKDSQTIESYADPLGSLPGPHADLIQILSALLIQLNALQAVMQEEPVDLPTIRESMITLEDMAREALSVVRAADEDEPPAELEGTTLSEALARLADETAETLGLSSRVSLNGVDEQGRPRERDVAPAIERVLYLAAREALYQVERHTGARRLRLVLTYGTDDIQMTIEDDGVLPTPTEEVASPAFANIEIRNELRPYIDLRHRIAHFGGSLEVGPISDTQKGTGVHVRIPYSVGVQFIAPSLPATVPTTIIDSDDTPPIRVLVVESQTVTRAGLHRLIESYKGLCVVGEAADGLQAVSETLELGPKVVLMDSQLPNGQSLEALRQIKQLNLDTKVLLLSAQDREEYLYETLRAGADGYVLKDIAPDELAQAIRVVARGEVLVQPQLAGRLLSRFGKQGGRTPYETLTARELEVLRLLARGLRNKEIAARLYVSERTVNFHLANIYQKLNVSGRTEALSKAIEQGLITT